MSKTKQCHRAQQSNKIENNAYRVLTAAFLSLWRHSSIIYRQIERSSVIGLSAAWTFEYLLAGRINGDVVAGLAADQMTTGRTFITSTHSENCSLYDALTEPVGGWSHRQESSFITARTHQRDLWHVLRYLMSSYRAKSDARAIHHASWSCGSDGDTTCRGYHTGISG